VWSTPTALVQRSSPHTTACLPPSPSPLHSSAACWLRQFPHQVGHGRWRHHVLSVFRCFRSMISSVSFVFF
jgi:hypothetical protein